MKKKSPVNKLLQPVIILLVAVKMVMVQVLEDLVVAALTQVRIVKLMVVAMAQVQVAVLP